MDTSSISGNGAEVDDMKRVLDGCKVLQDWSKEIIQNAWMSKWHSGEECHLNLNSRLVDESVKELIGCIELLRDRVKVLNLKGNSLTTKGAIMLFDSLRATRSQIREIILSFNILDDDCMDALGKYIKFVPYIENVDCFGNSVSDKGVSILIPYFEGNTTFKSMILSGNREVTNASVKPLIKTIESSHIESILVNDTKMHQKFRLALPLAINNFKYKSKRLDMNFMSLKDNNIIQMCEQMKKYQIDKLEIIDFGVNKITSKGASVLFSTLKECKSRVEILYFFDNHLDDKCMNCLGEYVANNQCVMQLHFGNNFITDKGIEILSEHLLGNTTLKSLDLNRNRLITDASVPFLIEIVKGSCITKMNISRTSISPEKLSEISETLRTPIDKRDIPIKSNTKSAAKILLSVSASA